MKCPTCGYDNPTDAQFCGGCGVNLISPEAAVGFYLPNAPAEEVGTKLPMVGFGEAVSRCFANYVTFYGRATRAEFWWWNLFIVGATFGLLIIDGLLTGGLAILLFALAAVIPSVAVAVRRLHDINKSGWTYLLHFGALLPFIGIVFTIYMVWLYVRKGGCGNKQIRPRPHTNHIGLSLEGPLIYIYIYKGRPVVTGHCFSTRRHS